MRKETQQKAIALRKRGQSYQEIIETLEDVSKSTLHHWLRGVVLSRTAQKRLDTHSDVAWRKGVKRFNDKRTKSIVSENNAELSAGQSEIGKLSQRELLLVGAALYWGEGKKTEKYKNKLAAILANADPALIRIFMRFLREILKISDDSIRAGIHIHEIGAADAAIAFWSEVTGLPSERFYISRQVSSASRMKRPKNILPFGVLHVGVNSRKIFYYIKGLMRGIADNG